MESKGRPGIGNLREESALNMFKQMDLKGKSAKDDTQLKTIHQNTIATVRSYDEAGGSVSKFSSKFCSHGYSLIGDLTAGSWRCRWKNSDMVRMIPMIPNKVLKAVLP